MSTISLPMVDVDISLDTAFSKMRYAGRSGLTWKKTATKFVIFKAADVVIAKTQGKVNLSELQGEIIETPDIQTIASSSPEPFLQLEKLSAALRAAGSQFGLLAVGTEGDKAAIVFSSAADILAKFELGPSDCYCEKCSEPLAKGQTCPIDGGSPVCKD